MDNNRIERASIFKYLGFYVDKRLSFNEHRRQMFQRIQKNSTILKHVSYSETSCEQARKLLFHAFISPYFQLLYVVWPLLSSTSIEHIEAKHRQLFRFIHVWPDASIDKVHCFPNYQTCETKAKRFLRRFIDKDLLALLISSVITKFPKPCRFTFGCNTMIAHSFNIFLVVASIVMCAIG